MIEDYAIK